jgi:retron-type reverse transcriptase
VKRIWPEIACFPNLYEAYREARVGKRYTESCLRFSWALEGRLFDIEGQLVNGTWRPSRPYEFQVIDPKPRLIQAPPFGDRVVHHALVRQIQPFFERRFIADSYACRRNLGVHAAVDRTQAFLRRGQAHWGEPWVLKADISKYFPSIDHGRLLAFVERVVADRDTLDLVEKIVAGYGYDTGVGLPLGALTSQLFANVYLDRLDHFVKERLGVKLYVRYMDDFVIVGPDKRTLWALHDDIADFLASELHLRLNRKTDVFPARHGVNFCGYRTWTTHRRPRKRTIKKARRRFRELAALYHAGQIGSEDVRPYVASFLGHMKHCDSHLTVEHILDDFVLVPPATRTPFESASQTLHAPL